jgi:hypothetical protein
MAEERTERPTPVHEQSTPQLVRSIATDTSTLVRKEIELAKQEVTEGLKAKGLGAAAFGAAGLFGFLGLVFGLVTAVAALSIVLPRWLAALVVAGALFLVAGIAAFAGIRAMKKPGPAPTETVRTVKEDVEWARAQLKR